MILTTIGATIPMALPIKNTQSWHNMHLAQPPGRNASIRLYWEDTPGACGFVKRLVCDENGVTFYYFVHTAVFCYNQTGSDIAHYYNRDDRKITIPGWKPAKILGLLEQRYGQKTRLTRDPRITLEDVIDFDTAEAMRIR